MWVSARSRKPDALTFRGGDHQNRQRHRATVCTAVATRPAFPLRVAVVPPMLHDQPILVIDDNVNLARGFATGLQRSGYRVNVAHTAEDGLKLADADHPAMIVVDFRMPFINGAGFLYRLRACPKYKNTPVLVVTGATVDDEMRTELADLHAVLRFKPLALVDLLAEVGALLGESTSSPLHAAG